MEMDTSVRQVPIYHEKQRLQFCLLHALNNLLQERDSFTRSELDAIANRLALNVHLEDRWTPLSLISKPHHNVLTGNYDVNVLMAALESRGFQLVWHDRRIRASSSSINSPLHLNPGDASLVGIVLNIPTSKFGGLWRSRHWIALRSIRGVWYNLDSDLKAPEAFQNQQQVLQFLDNIVAQGGEVFIVSLPVPAGQRHPPTA